MIGRIVEVSTADHDPAWGLDQELGALHILERLAEIAPSRAARARALELAAVARRYEASRTGDTLYLAQVAVPGDFDDLSRLFHPTPGSEAEFLITSLQRSSRIYHNYTLAQRGQPTGYENMRERETSMKTRFMEEYRRAQATGDTLPRVLLKLGHWHTYRGIYRGNVPTFGNFASELAVANGMDSFLMATWVIEGPDEWRNSSAFISLALPGEQFTLIDFRPLRPYAHQGMIAELSDVWKSLFFRADAALVIRGGYRWQPVRSPQTSLRCVASLRCVLAGRGLRAARRRRPFTLRFRCLASHRGQHSGAARTNQSPPGAWRCDGSGADGCRAVRQGPAPGPSRLPAASAP